MAEVGLPHHLTGVVPAIWEGEREGERRGREDGREKREGERRGREREEGREKKEIEVWGGRVLTG